MRGSTCKRLTWEKQLNFRKVLLILQEALAGAPGRPSQISDPDIAALLFT